MSQSEILYLEDPYGVSPKMQHLMSRLGEGYVTGVSLYRVMDKNKILRKLNNRKAPSFSEDATTQSRIRNQLRKWMTYYQPRVIVTTDPATLFL